MTAHRNAGIGRVECRRAASEVRRAHDPRATVVGRDEQHAAHLVQTHGMFKCLMYVMFAASLASQQRTTTSAAKRSQTHRQAQPPPTEVDISPPLIALPTTFDAAMRSRQNLLRRQHDLLPLHRQTITTNLVSRSIDTRFFVRYFLLKRKQAIRIAHRT